MMDSNLPRLIGKRVCWLVSCPIHRLWLYDSQMVNPDSIKGL